MSSAPDAKSVELDAKPTSPESTPARRYERTPAWPPMAKRREKSALTLDERPDERPNERQGEEEEEHKIMEAAGEEDEQQEEEKETKSTRGDAKTRSSM